MINKITETAITEGLKDLEDGNIIGPFNSSRVYGACLRQKKVKQQLKNEATSHSKKDLEVLNEWFSVDRELLENKE